MGHCTVCGRQISGSDNVCSNCAHDYIYGKTTKSKFTSNSKTEINLDGAGSFILDSGFLGFLAGIFLNYLLLLFVVLLPVFRYTSFKRGFFIGFCSLMIAGLVFGAVYIVVFFINGGFTLPSTPSN